MNTPTPATPATATVPTASRTAPPAAAHHTVTVATPVGPFTILFGREAVVGAGFTPTVDGLLPLVHPDLVPDRADHTTVDIDAVVGAVHRYFAGDVTALDGVPVRQAGTGFRQEVWRQLRRVPPGHQVTYTRLAEISGRPAAVRAAASGCATNAVSLFVPCHRVVRTDGGLGGYLWGTDVKKRLIAHEGTAAN